MWALDDERDDDLLVLGYPYFEHDTVPWEALPGKMTRVANGEWQISERPERLPHTYNLQARKPC